ncbi:TonB-dependent receptor [Aureibaculum sp. A20]|uniref:TonB-dependent receptor n=1 Tax=Aureibaculum flavum TaxID=2795986 RepID=A0ABS0WST0_9FLAO|nr:TonB-dependent receptor [Aureibaculum flavum]MBJ2175037.1 TonB-dependent receptor [Aureibaculum flavum]
MKTKFSGFLTLLLAFMVQLTFAQEKTVSGTVSDETGPLPGVNILIKGTTIGTDTDFDGNYSIKAKAGDVLVFSFVGMQSIQKTVGNNNTISIVMQSDNLLEEVVVTAYGTQKKESLTGSVAEIKSEEFAKAPSGNAITGLTGKVAGVQIYAGSGQPGAAPSVRFRGIGSLTGSSEPLYVVDGVPFNESITSINPNDIESMSFVKDASAASLYGSRGANGVVIITTKKGKKGKLSVNLDLRTSFTDRAVKDYDFIDNGGDYYETYHKMLKGGFITDGGLSEADAGQKASDELITGPVGLVYNTYGGDNTSVVSPNGQIRSGSPLWTSDWEDELFDNSSGVNTAYLSVSGGSENTTYFFSAGHEDNTGYNINTGFKRYTFNTTIDSDVTDNIKFGANVNYSNREQKGTLTNNITGNFNWVRVVAPIYPVYALDHATGIPVTDANGNKLYDSEAVTSPNSLGVRPFNGFSNPVALQKLNVNESQRDNFTSRFYSKIKFLKDFTFTYNFGLDLANYNTVDYTNKIVGSGIAPNARITEEYGRGQTFTNQQLLNYSTLLGDRHTIDILVGHESSNYNFKNIEADKKDQFISTDLSLDLFAENDGSGSVRGGANEYNLEAYFARALYDFDNKYYINGSIRRDGSSVFSPDNRWGTFYGAGAAWRVSQENFMADVSWISELKLKTSFGQLGNDVVYYPLSYTGNVIIRNYAPYLDQWDVVSDGLDFSLTKTVLGNEDLKWETSTNFNAGFELRMFNDKLTIEAEYFQRKISDLLYNRPLSPSSGLPSVPENVMDMQNTGVELSIAYNIINNENLTWDFDVNATSYKNEITKLAPGREFIDNGIYRWVKGGGAYDYFTRKFEGVNSTTGMTQWGTDFDFEEDGTTPTNGITEDYSRATEYAIGKTALPDVYGGFSTTVNYKNFDFGLDFSYQIGGYAYDNIYSGGFTGKTGQNFHNDYSQTWSYDNTTASLPRIVEGSNNYSTSDFYLEDATHISLNNISLGYSIPESVLDKVGIDNIRVYGLANNLALWTKSDRQGFDPRASVTGGNNTVRYSTLKTVAFGVTVKF